MNINNFASFFDRVGMASALLAGEDFPSFSIDQLKLDLVCFSDNYYSSGHNELMNEIEDKLNLCQNKELYILGVLKKIRHYKYLNIDIDLSEEVGLLREVKRMEAAHKYIKNYQETGYNDTDNLPGMYLIICWEVLNHFMKNLDQLLLIYNIDLIDLQRKYSVNIWYRVVNGIISIPQENGRDGEVNTANKEKPTRIDIEVAKEELGKYFMPQFKGMGRNFNYLDTFIDHLQTPRSAKEYAQIALMCFEGKQMNNQKGREFSKWYKVFCEIVGCDHKTYDNKNKLRGSTPDHLKKVFLYLE